MSAAEYTEPQPSLHAEWTNAHIARTYRMQTTIDTLFALLQSYKNVSEIAEDYLIDLTPQDHAMLRQFAIAFKSDTNSYKKKHWFWLLSPAYYFRKQKAARAKKLYCLLAQTAPATDDTLYLPVSIGTAGHETPTFFSTRQHNNHLRPAITE